jgi:hypothetical protein
VLEVAVDRRLEQRRNFEAVLDEQTAVTDRDVVRKAVMATLRARVVRERDSAEECGADENGR